MSLTLEIPDEQFQAMRLPPLEIEARLLLSLHAQQVLGLGKAAELAGISRSELNQTLAKRGIPMHYSEKQLAEDVAYAHRGQ